MTDKECSLLYAQLLTRWQQSKAAFEMLHACLQRFAGVYKKVVFLHFYAESNEMTKYLDQKKLKVERHPHFAFFRNGKQ